MKFSNAQIYCYTYNEEVGDIRWVFQTKARIFNDKNYEQPKMHVIFWTKLKKTKKEWYDFVMQEIGKNLSNIGKCFETLGYKVYTEYMKNNSWKWKIHIPSVDICKKNDEGKNLIVANIFPREYLLADKTGGKCWLCDLK